LVGGIARAGLIASALSPLGVIGREAHRAIGRIGCGAEHDEGLLQQIHRSFGGHHDTTAVVAGAAFHAGHGADEQAAGIAPAQTARQHHIADLDIHIGADVLEVQKPVKRSAHNAFGTA